MRAISWGMTTFFVNGLLPALLLIAVGSGLDRLLRRSPARLRHLLWLAVLLACLAFPTASLLRPAPSRPAAAPVAPAARPAPAAARGGDWNASPSFHVSYFSAELAVLTSIFWSSCFLYGAWRLGQGWARARGIVRRSRPLEVPAALAAQVERCRAAFGVQSAEILGSPEVASPVTLGALRPVILLPTGFFATASPEDVASALGHEMAHIRRRDYATHLLCEILLLPLAYNPGAPRLLRHQLAETREMACDEAVVERLVRPQAYARSLLSLAASAAGLPRPSATLGVHNAQTLEVRMKKILDHRPPLRPRAARALLGAALLLLGGSSLALFAGVSARAVDAKTRRESGRPISPFVGTWSGFWAPEKPGEKPVRALDLEIDSDGQIVETWYRYQKDADGQPVSQKVERPVTGFRAEGNTLTLIIKTDGFSFRDQPAERAEILESLQLQGQDTAVFNSLSNSYFEALKKRGEPVPPPPPPLPMKRQP
jgi:beta-lactamase regulating signal transducer with metallopeptidase domain